MLPARHGVGGALAVKVLAGGEVLAFAKSFGAGRTKGAVSMMTPSSWFVCQSPARP